MLREHRDHDAAAALVRAIRYVPAQIATVAVGSGEPDPGGPVRIVAEYQNARDSLGVTTLGLVAVLGMYLLFPVFVLDVVRLVLLARRRRG